MKRIVLNVIGASLLLTNIPAQAGIKELKAHAQEFLSSAVEYCKQIPVRSMVNTVATASWNAAKGGWNQVLNHPYIAASGTALAAAAGFVFVKKQSIKNQLNKAFDMDWDQCNSSGQKAQNPKFLQTIRRLYGIKLNYEHLRDVTKEIDSNDALQEELREYLVAYDTNNKKALVESSRNIFEALKKRSIFSLLF